MWVPRELEALAPQRAPRAAYRRGARRRRCDHRAARADRTHARTGPCRPTNTSCAINSRPQRLRLPRPGRARAASRTHDSRPGNRSGRRRWPAILRPRTGDQRPRRAHGSALPSRWRRRRRNRCRIRGQRITLMLLIKNGRVLDPASNTDASLDILIDGRAHLASRSRISHASPTPKFSTPPAWSSLPASLICTATCANPARRFPKPSRPARAPRHAAALRLCAPCRTRSP